MEASRAKHRVHKSATQQRSQPTKRNTATVIGKGGHGAFFLGLAGLAGPT